MILRVHKLEQALSAIGVLAKFRADALATESAMLDEVESLYDALPEPGIF